MKRFLLSILAIAGLAVVSPPAGAASPIDCGAETSEAGVTICADPGLMWIDGVLAATSAAFNTANAGRNGRLRNLVSAQAGWERDRRDRCGADLSCLADTYVDRINRVRDQIELTPVVWQLQEDGSSILAEYPGPAAIPPMPRAFVAPEQLGLLGHWRGSLACGGRDTLLELTLEPGFPGTLVGFIGMSDADFPADDPLVRAELEVQQGREATTLALVGSNRVHRQRPGFTFSTLEVALSPDGETLSGHIVEASCPEFALRRAEGSSVLAASIGLAQGRDWSWPYDPAAVPNPYAAAYCAQWIDWDRRFEVHYVSGALGGELAREGTMAAVNMLDDPGLVALLGGPYETLTQDQRWAVRDVYRKACLNNPLVSRAFGPGFHMLLRVVEAQEVTEEYRTVVARLGEIRAARAWKQQASDALVAAAETPEGFPLAVRYGAEAERQLATLLHGDIADFAATVADVRHSSAPHHARAEVGRAGSAGEGMEQLGALGTVLDVLAPAFAEMDEADVAELVAQVRGREDAVLEGEMARMTAALASFGTGLAAVEAGRAWYGELIARFGGYRDREAVADALAAFAARRPGDVAAAADELAVLIAAAGDQAALDAIGLRYVVADLDMSVPAVGQAYEERRAQFEWDRLVAGYSPYEKTLAGAGGRLAVPAD